MSPGVDVPAHVEPESVSTVRAGSWYALSTSAELSEGVLRSARLGSRELVVYRGQSGRVHAADAHCPRRGCPLVAGEVIGDSIKCPLDGWTWSPDGSLSVDGADSSSWTDVRLRFLPVHVAAGLILVQAGAEVMPHDAATLQLPDGAWTASAMGVVSAHPFAAVESFMDPATVSYLIGEGTVGTCEVVVDEPALLHVRHHLAGASVDSLDVRAHGPGLVLMSDGRGTSLLFAATPTASEVAFHVAVLGEAPGIDTSGVDWTATAERARRVCEAIRYDDGSAMSDAEARSLAMIRQWLAAGSAVGSTTAHSLHGVEEA